MHKTELGTQLESQCIPGIILGSVKDLERNKWSQEARR